MIGALASQPQTEPRLAWCPVRVPHRGTPQGRIAMLRVSVAPIPVPMSLKSFVRIVSLALLTFLLSAPNVLAASNAVVPLPKLLPAPPLPAVPSLGAKAYYLIDVQSGQVLAQKNADAHWPPASTTKLMTLYILLQEIRSGQMHLNTMLPVSEKAWRASGSRMFLKEGTTVSVGNLIQGILVPSGNDAAVTVAEGVAGSTNAFVSLMNAYAKRLGMSNSHFTGVSGLPAKGLYVSAQDLATLTDHMISEFPQVLQYASEKSFTYNKITQANYNKLLWIDASADGLKTGWTQEAGYNLVATAKRNGTRLIAVILGVNPGPPSTAQGYRHLGQVAESLLDWGFRFHTTRKLYPAAASLAKVRVWFGSPGTIQVGPAQALYVTVPKGRYSQLQASMQLPASLQAPVTKGQTIGRVKIRLNGKLLQNVPLISLQAAPRGGLWLRMKDTVLRWFEKH